MIFLKNQKGICLPLIWRVSNLIVFCILQDLTQHIHSLNKARYIWEHIGLYGAVHFSSFKLRLMFPDSITSNSRNDIGCLFFSQYILHITKAIPYMQWGLSTDDAALLRMIFNPCHGSPPWPKVYLLKTSCQNLILCYKYLYCNVYHDINWLVNFLNWFFKSSFTATPPASLDSKVVDGVYAHKKIQSPLLGRIAWCSVVVDDG